jgi:hypothetical protein
LHFHLSKMILLLSLAFTVIDAFGILESTTWCSTAVNSVCWRPGYDAAAIIKINEITLPSDLQIPGIPYSIEYFLYPSKSITTWEEMSRNAVLLGGDAVLQYSGTFSVTAATMRISNSVRTGTYYLGVIMRSLLEEDGQSFPFIEMAPETEIKIVSGFKRNQMKPHIDHPREDNVLAESESFFQLLNDNDGLRDSYGNAKKAMQSTYDILLEQARQLWEINYNRMNHATELPAGTGPVVEFRSSSHQTKKQSADDENSVSDCCICREEFQDGERIEVGQCTHKCHSYCLGAASHCPECRGKIRYLGNAAEPPEIIRPAPSNASSSSGRPSNRLRRRFACCTASRTKE